MNFIDNYKKSIIQKLLSHQEILTVYCAGTNMPLVECGQDTFADRVYVFDSDEMLKKFAAAIADQKLPLKGVKFLSKDKIAFFTMLLTCNIDEILFMDPQGRHVIQLSDIIKKNDMSKLPAEKRPVENPQLKLCGAYFAQEACRKVPPQEKHLREMEEELSANIAKATFIVPILLADQEPGSQPSEPQPDQPAGELGNDIAEEASDGKNQVRKIKFPLIKTQKGDLFQPVFTDNFEFARYNKGKTCRAMAVPFVKLKALLAKESTGFMINPNGFHLVVTPQMLKGLEQRFYS